VKDHGAARGDEHRWRVRTARVRFARPQVADIQAELRAQLMRHSNLAARNASIAIAVGSRGIANLECIVGTIVACLRSAGARPFVVPAMGSHGGATADGQRQLLASYGITEAAMGCPVHSSMDVVELDATGLSHRLWWDRWAAGADGVVLVNRIKPHTDFHGAYESGLAKMAVIGLGKEHQAAEMHRFGAAGLRDLIPAAAAKVLAMGRVLAGVATVENAYDETAAITVVPGQEILAREPALLDMARQNMPRLPIQTADLLIVDQIGKNISGTGMDTNVIGRVRIAGEPEAAAPRIRAIVATDLTPESHGNATGAGLADVITRRLFEKIDFEITYRNVFTSGFLERGKVPIVAPTDAEACACALRACGDVSPERARVVRVRSTLQLDQIQLSALSCEDVEERADVEVGPAFTCLFDEGGRLVPFATTAGRSQ
jgi:hypothetical protein